MPEQPSIPLEHAETLLHLMELTADVRSIEGLDYEAARRLARWVLACHPGLRDKYPLHCKLGMGRPL